MRLGLSVLEKYVLRRGFELADRCDQGLVLTRARHRGLEAELVYPKPTYHFLHLDREAVTQRLLAELAAVEGLTPQAMALKALAEFDLPPQGFACLRCGTCCQRLPDAVRGRVSVEEVQEWERLGREDILAHVTRVERPGYRLYLAWTDPATGLYLERCPWLAPLAPDQERGGMGCAIHDVKPLKCRAYPAGLEAARRTGCRAVKRRDAVAGTEEDAG